MTSLWIDQAKSMVWRLNRWPLLVGVRTYRLTPGPQGATQFTVDEVVQGLLLPLIAKSMPDFRCDVRAHSHGPESRCRGSDAPRSSARIEDAREDEACPKPLEGA